jgi:hypothetical protein
VPSGKWLYTVAMASMSQRLHEGSNYPHGTWIIGILPKIMEKL